MSDDVSVIIDAEANFGMIGDLLLIWQPSSCAVDSLQSPSVMTSWRVIIE